MFVMMFVKKIFFSDAAYNKYFNSLNNNSKKTS